MFLADRTSASAEHGVPGGPTPVTLEPPRVLAKGKRWGVAWRQRLVIATLIFSDILLAGLVWMAAYALQSVLGEGKLTGVAVATIMPSVAVWVGLRALLGLYPGYGLDPVERLRRNVYSVLAALAILAVFAVGFQVGNLLSRPLLILAFMGLLFAAPVVQYLTQRGMRRVGLWGKPTVLLSYKDTGAQFLDLLEQEWGLGYNPVALFDYDLSPAGGAFEEASYEKVLADACELGRKQGVGTAIFATPYTRREQLARMVSEASDSFRQILIMPNLAGVTTSAVIARDFAGNLAVEMKYNLLDPWARRLKRTLDLFGAVVGGLLISPLLLAIVIAIKLDSPGPAFYGHRRLGTRDGHFLCWKFRTMHVNAEGLLDRYLQGNATLQAEWEQNHKLCNDPRVTRVGRLLRKVSLDELPQLWNVLLGEMSLTGPRPIVDAEVPKYKEDYALYKRIRPGMSGFWQVSGRSDTDYDERVAMDSYYVRNWSVWLDVFILARTVKVVLYGRGAY